MTALPKPVLVQLRTLRKQRDPRWRHYAVALNASGWSWDQLAVNLGITRQSLWSSVAPVRVTGADPDQLDGLILPGPPPEGSAVKRRKRGRSPYKRREVHIADVALLRGLWSISSKRRGPTPPGSDPARAHDELLVVVRRLLLDGYSVGDIAVAAGADVTVVRHRLRRAGLRASDLRSEGEVSA